MVLFRGHSRYDLFMATQKTRQPVPYDRPTTYQICVQGQIDQTWSDRLEGMTIHLASMEGEPSITTLEGELSDQAALAGVLNTLYEMHLTVILVKRLNS